MAERQGPSAEIEARVIIEGPAEEILRALRLLRGGARSVHLEAEVPARHYMDRFHSLPVIKESQTQAAMAKVETMARQTERSGGDGHLADHAWCICDRGLRCDQRVPTARHQSLPRFLSGR